MPKPRKYPRYVEWLHSQPCVVTGRLPVEAHHLTRLAPMNRMTRNDRYMVPLSPDLHNFGRESVHVMGVTKFEALHGVDLTEAAERYWNKWEQENG